MIAMEQEQRQGRKLTTRQIADMAGCTVSAVCSWITHGVPVGGLTVRLRARKLGRWWRIEEADFDLFERLCNGEELREVAQQQDAERQQARRDQRRLRDRLGGE